MRILFVCSWLDVKTKAGWFFVEQSLYIQRTGKLVEIELLKFQSNSFLKLLLKVFNKGRIETIENVKFHTFDVLRFESENQINLVINKWVLYKQFNRLKTKYDILHAQSFFDAGYYTYLIGRKYKIPTVLTEHNQLNFLKSKFKHNTIKKILNSFNKRLVVSNEVIKQFSSHGFNQEFKVIHNPLDPLFYINISGTTIPNNKKINIVHIGAFTPIKNQNAILKLLKRLDNDGWDIEFIWIGYDTWGGDCKPEIENLVKDLGFSNRITIKLFSRIDKDQMTRLIVGKDLAISASLCETFGLGNAECIALGIPLLTTDNGGSREFTNSSNSVVVRISDDEALYRGFLQWYKQREQFDKQFMSDEIRLKLSPEVFANRMIGEYNNILN
jgi:glycosyltransferase involved in cell wall biosynthesis